MAYDPYVVRIGDFDDDSEVDSDVLVKKNKIWNINR